MASSKILDFSALRKIECWVGVALFLLAGALYASKMATSFASGDTARYLNLANTGELGDRGNGLPLYITLLNLAAKLPLPVDVSDGVRCNLFTVLVAASSIAIVYVGSLRLTRNLAAAAGASVTLMVSGLVWFLSIQIMPHIYLVLIGAVFVLLLLKYDSTRSRRLAVALGLVCGLGFGLMPNSLLFLAPSVLAVLLMARTHQRRTHVGSCLIGFTGGVIFNIVLIIVHELWRPTVSSELPLHETVLFFLSGGEESEWFLEKTQILDVVIRFLEFPLSVAYDIEMLGVILASVGLAAGLRGRPHMHLVLLLAFVIVAIWVGKYPGDTRLYHGLMAYPIVGFWLAGGASVLVRFVWRWRAGDRPYRERTIRYELTAGGVLVLAILGAIAVGQITYRQAICPANEWYLSGLCRERVPDRIGDKYLQRTQRAIATIPEGALVVGAMWFNADQLNYFIRVRKTRHDLLGALDLTRLSDAELRSRAEEQWSQDKRVFLYGDWKHVERSSPFLVAHYRSELRGELLFELLPNGERNGKRKKEEMPEETAPGTLNEGTNRSD